MRVGVWGDGSMWFGFFLRVVGWVRGWGLGVLLSLYSFEWSSAGGCCLWGWVCLWFGLGSYSCVAVVATTWCAIGASGGVGKVMDEVNDVLV